MEICPHEREALEALSESSDPMALVIYHMSMRMLAMSERLSNIEGNQQKTIQELERAQKEGRQPNFQLLRGQLG